MIAVDTNVLVYAHCAETPALGFLAAVLGSASGRLLLPGPTFPERFAEACRDGRAAGNLAFDAQIVAVRREHGVATILTEDRDFGRFTNPAPLGLET